MPREEGGDAMEMDASSPTHGPVPQPTRPAADREVPSSGPGGLLVPLKTETNVEVSQAKTEVVAEDMEVESGGQKDTAQQEDPMEGSFTWVIEKYDEIQDKKLYSDNFTIGGYKWRLLIFPKGNGTQHVSLYLDVADSDTLPYCWSRSASFTLSVLNHLDPELSHRKDAQHVFCEKESDWGFTQFLSLDELLNDQKGFVSTGRGGAGGERGSVTIEARVKVLREDNSKKDSKKKAKQPKDRVQYLEKELNKANRKLESANAKLTRAAFAEKLLEQKLEHANERAAFAEMFLAQKLDCANDRAAAAEKKLEDSQMRGAEKIHQWDLITNLVAQWIKELEGRFEERFEERFESLEKDLKNLKGQPGDGARNCREVEGDEEKEEEKDEDMVLVYGAASDGSPIPHS